MKRIRSGHAAFCTLFSILSLLITLAACTRSTKDIVPSAEFAPYVNAYTGGVISQNSPIRIELAQDLAVVDLNSELKENPFDFSPSLKGKAYWISNNTIEFMPEEGSLKPGVFYEAAFNLGHFVEVEKRLSEFNFSFRVQERNFSIYVGPPSITATAPHQVTVRGEVRWSDVVSKADVEKMLSAQDDKHRKYPVKVIATDTPTLFLFEISSVERQTADYSLEIEADGTVAGIDRRQSKTCLIPAKGSFRFLSAERIEQPENGIEITFSAPVSTTQELKGLIEIPEISSSLLQVKENKVSIYFEASQLNQLTLKIDGGLKDYNNKSLGAAQTISFSELFLKPQVEIASPAAILPDSKNLIIPFRAVNLHAVDLSIIRIFETNVLSFMQSNTLASAGELRRLGRLVYKKTLQLSKDRSKDVHRWEDYSIDMAGLVKQEPGAIYRVVLSFNREYSAYPCSGQESAKNLNFADNSPANGLTKVGGTSIGEKEEAEWDIPSSYFYYSGTTTRNWDEYDWQERNNPCHASYYMLAERAASCNVFASNVGMIVKRNALNKLWVAVSNILDAQPIKGAEVTAYNYQLKAIGTAKTDGDGFAEIASTGVPFIVVAEAEKQKAFVRVADGEEQSVSRFDTGGKETQKGLKGFVYTERGVWRPGDTLHVTFLLEDREKRIPDRHPVALELYNPRGQFYTKAISTQGLNGFYTFAIATRADDPTGLWNAYVKVGGTAFHKSLRIETVKPNRLKINLKFPQEAMQVLKGSTSVLLSSSWLTGATAALLNAKVEMSLSKVNTQFKNYEQYLFNNPATEFATVKSEVFEGKLDASGKTGFLLQLPQATHAPGMLNATLTARVFEPGGEASIYTQSIPFSPFAAYVGVNLHQPKGKFLETDKEHLFDIVTLDPQGKLIDRNNLEYKIYRIEWSWWWENQEESFATYINNSRMTPVAGGTLHTKAGKTRLGFRIDYPNWGRYLVYIKDKESGHATGGTVYIDWPDWRGRSSKSDPSGIKMLAFSLDKESYEAGQTATATIPAAAGGRALVSIENGASVLQRQWIDITSGKDTKYSFEVTPEMAPNVYLHISLLQPHAQTVNDLPIRMYGVMPVPVTNKHTVLQPQLKMPEVLRPETSFNVTVSEKNGQPMTYTLALVDDGLLDLTNFKTPNAWNEFYAREALGIRTWDMYDNVLGAFAGHYGSLFSTGGDETLKPTDAKANRFRPVVKFIGPFALSKGKQNTHTLKLPMYVGSVRAMIVAGQDGAYGSAEKTAFVRTPLMLLSTLPRVLSTQEEIIVPVNLFAMEKGVKQATVSIKATGAGVQVVGSRQQSAAFQQPGDRLVYFTLKTGHRTGKVTLHLTATGGGEQAQESIEVEVRNPHPTVTLRTHRWMEAGQSATLDYSFEGATEGRNALWLEVARIPSVDIGRRLDFLANYRHQCTEQLTSKALPLLFVGKLKALNEKEDKEIKSSIQEAIQALYARQLPNGGFVYWPGNAVADEWITSYAGQFLLLAQEKGYAVNGNVLTKWQRFQRAAAQNRQTARQEEGRMQWQANYLQAYRLYTLALAGVPEYGAMNRMKEQTNLPLQAKWSLAAAYALTGKTRPAAELVFNAETSVAPYSAENYIYGSTDRDEAMILETLLLLKRQQAALQQARKVSQNLAREEWLNTQSTAFSIMAMGKMAEQLSGTLDFSWTWNGHRQPAVKSAKALFEKELLPATGTGSIEVKNQGKGALSIDLMTRIQLLNDTLPAIANNLRLEVRYTDSNGTPISIESLRQGTDFLATISVSNSSGTSHYQHLALTHLIPSGWEIYNERMALPAEALVSRNYTYQDIRDDRILTYFDLQRGEEKRFTVRLQAAYAGNFVLPAIQCEAMYDNTVQARTKGGRTMVTIP